jgi:hypothetical protein
MGHKVIFKTYSLVPGFIVLPGTTIALRLFCLTTFFLAAAF